MAMSIDLDDMMIVLVLVVALFFVAREVRRGFRHGLMYEITGHDPDVVGPNICEKNKEPWNFRFLMIFYIAACIAIAVLIVCVFTDWLGLFSPSSNVNSAIGCMLAANKMKHAR